MGGGALYELGEPMLPAALRGCSFGHTPRTSTRTAATAIALRPPDTVHLFVRATQAVREIAWGTSEMMVIK